ncbi:hypothetical protein GYH30_014542 [Glycine max]|uniref:Uncharacterized protein n=1 Tax=Glycine max TaxID=3847 RepID=A0A0R0JMD6_SOYBN|nr:hypothetical protein GYH30_014542 [Glycine max]
MPRKEFGKVLIKIEFLFSPINGKDKDPCQSWKHESKKGKNKDTHTTRGWLQKGSRNSESNCLVQLTKESKTWKQSSQAEY